MSFLSLFLKGVAISYLLTFSVGLGTLHIHEVWQTAIKEHRIVMFFLVWAFRLIAVLVATSIWWLSLSL